MAHYYYIGAALPPLAIGLQPELSFIEVRDMVAMNATSKDFAQVVDLCRPIDLSNIRALWMHMPLDDRGNYTAKELEEKLLVREEIPAFLDEFLDRYDSVEDRLRYFSSLYASFYKEMQETLKSGFLQRYFAIEREIRLILTALRAKRYGYDIVRELQFEDPSDLLVMDILAQKDAEDYIPSQEYEGLRILFLNYASDPKPLHKALLEYRFHKIEEMEEGKSFSMDNILGYMARLLLVESWQGLKEEQGAALVKDLSKYG